MINMNNEKEKKPKYDYSAQTDSYVDALIMKFLPKLVNIIPYGVPANMITICSNTCAFIAFVIAMLSVKNIYTLWFAIPFLLLAYLMGDCLDGAQARRTHTGSQLGEFMDHFLDCFVTGELVIPVLVCYHVRNPWIAFIILTKSYITQASAFWERHKNGHMYFGKFSSSETVLSLATIMTLSYFNVIRNFVEQPLNSFEFINKIFGTSWTAITNLSVAEFFICVFFCFTLISDVMTFVRTRGASLRFWSYCIAVLLVTSIFAIQNPDFYYIQFYVISFMNIDYIASLIISITTKKREPHPDYLFVAFVVISFVLKLNVNIALIIELSYLTVKILTKALCHIIKFRECWYWKNPAPVVES